MRSRVIFVIWSFGDETMRKELLCLSYVYIVLFENCFDFWIVIIFIFFIVFIEFLSENEDQLKLEQPCIFVPRRPLAQTGQVNES